MAATDIPVELYHRTQHEVCLTINGEMFIFEDQVSQREYDIGNKIWNAVENKKQEAL